MKFNVRVNDHVVQNKGSHQVGHVNIFCTIFLESKHFEGKMTLK